MKIENFDSQNDARWKDVSIGGNHTWGSFGCLGHCLLHFASYFGFIDVTDPKYWITVFKDNRVIVDGFMPLGGLWATRFLPFHLRVNSVSNADENGITQAIDYINKKIPVFVMVDGRRDVGLQTHWMLAVAHNGKRDTAQWSVADPYSGKHIKLGEYYRKALEFVFIEPIKHKPYKIGIDLSHHQNVSRYNFFDVEFAYVRATFGQSNDRSYGTHIKNLVGQKKPFSPYHFLLSENVEEQAFAFIRAIKANHRPTHRPIIDFEEYNGVLPSEELLLKFISIIENQLSVKVGIYSRANLLEKLSNSVLDRPIIQAHYSETRDPLPYGKEPCLWQFSEFGRMHWYDSNVDWNYILDLGKLTWQ